MTNFLGPFKIMEKIGLVAYRLELPKSSSIHSVFHVSQLKKVVGDHKLEQSDVMSYLTENYEWIAKPEEIYEYTKNKKGEWEALVKWQGLPP